MRKQWYAVTYLVCAISLLAPAVVLAEGNALVAWGRNDDGQATVPPDMSGVKAIAAGGYHSLALLDDGTVVAWGNNISDRATVPAGLTGVKAIAAGWSHNLALLEDGTVVNWGDNWYFHATPPPGLSGVTAIAAGSYHSLALKEDGTVVAWGLNLQGETMVPPGLSGVVAISAGSSLSLALRDDGTVVAWGSNDEGQSTVPPGLSGVTAIAAGTGHCLALREDGTVVAWGRNDAGQSTVPPSLNGVTAIAAGYRHSLALKANGTVVAWGVDSGPDDCGQSRVLPGLMGVTAIAAGGYHSLALSSSDGWPEHTVYLPLVLNGFNPIYLRTGISNINEFLDQCPTEDPALAQILADFTIRLDGEVVEKISCTEPYSEIPIGQLTQELITLQVLRTAYYMDPGFPGHLPWTQMSLYDWMAANIGGINLKTAPVPLDCCDQFDGELYVSQRVQSDEQREYKRYWPGISSTLAYFAHQVRHADGGPGHVTGCEAFPDPNDPPGCDESYDLSNLGSYGVQYWLHESWMTGHLHVGISCNPETAYEYVGWHYSAVNLTFGDRFVNSVPPEAKLPDPPYGGPCYRQ